MSGDGARWSVDVRLDDAQRAALLREDALTGLAASPKSLPPRWFYDDAGSALFERITVLPEYYLTRAEREILAAHAGRIAALAGVETLAELGSGASEKTRFLLDAMTAGGALRLFAPMDVCRPALEAAGRTLLAAYPSLRVGAVVGDFTLHLDALPRVGRRMVAFLGSTIGNLEPAERARFYAALRRGAEPGDMLLLGADLVKPAARLEAAYDDAAGVTAAFNRNVLAVVNRELGAHFVLEGFEHVARWDAAAAWMDIRLRARAAQSVEVAALARTVTFAAGEEMRTEISAKFRRAGLQAELGAAGFAEVAWWTDGAGDFSLSLWRLC